MLCDSECCLNSMANIGIFALADNLSGQVKVSRSNLASVGSLLCWCSSADSPETGQWPILLPSFPSLQCAE